uniref:Uncharacterized protein n=1 Tax=Caenorhabditis angaria TaxID=860376 RepID=B6VC00_9PELO|nr:hypothetical protein Csp3_JD06.009 [Caenorhabditis angaria]
MWSLYSKYSPEPFEPIHLNHEIAGFILAAALVILISICSAILYQSVFQTDIFNIDFPEENEKLNQNDVDFPENDFEEKRTLEE